MSENKDLNKRFDELEKRLDSLMVVNPLSQSFYQQSRSDEIDLRELWNVIWQGKWIIGGVTFFFGVVSVIYALSLPDIYKSEALLAPAEENSGGGLAGMAGQLGGLASLAGINLGSGGADKTALAIEVLRSREFVSKFIAKHDLLVTLVAARNWDRDRNELLIDPDIYDQERKKWVRPHKPPFKAEPSMQEAYKSFTELFSVSEDKKSNFVTVSVRHYSPFVAKQWVDWLVEGINYEIKAREVAEAKKSIEYLSSQLTKTSIADMKSIFYELIEEQSKTIMFAEVRDEYVFKTVDSAVVPEVKIKPSKRLIFVFALIFGVVIGSLFVFMREFLSEWRKVSLGD